MSQHLNIYSQKGCIGCKNCEGGGANILRKLTLVTLAVPTLGLGLLILPFYKKCQFCGHNTWFNKHATPGEQNTLPTAPSVQA